MFENHTMPKGKQQHLVEKIQARIIILKTNISFLCKICQLVVIINVLISLLLYSTFIQVSSRNWYHQNAGVFDWQHICYVWWMCFATDSRHTYGYKMCPSSRQLVPLTVRGRPHAKVSREKRKEASQILNFKFRCMNDVLSLNISMFDNLVDRSYYIELEIENTTDTTRPASNIHIEIDSKDWLRTKCYDKREDFTLWTFHLYVAIFQQHLQKSIYLPVKPIFQSLWCASGFPW